MFLVATIVFVILRLTPGDPAAVMLGPQASQQDIDTLRARMGLDQSLPMQYATWLGQPARGDLGQPIVLVQPMLGAGVGRVGEEGVSRFRSRGFPRPETKE